MKKAVKVLGVTTAGVGLCAGLSFLKEYRKMKKVEARLESLPLHQLKEKMSEIHHKEEKTIIEVADDLLLLDKLRICSNILFHGGKASQ